MTTNTSMTKPVLLCILDGWGERASSDDNAIVAAQTPVMDRVKKSNPFAVLEASEPFAGLPIGQMGNSEAGHMHLGAGPVVLQDLPRIDQALADAARGHSPKLKYLTHP